MGRRSCSTRRCTSASAPVLVPGIATLATRHTSPRGSSAGWLMLGARRLLPRQAEDQPAVVAAACTTPASPASSLGLWHALTAGYRPDRHARPRAFAAVGRSTGALAQRSLGPDAPRRAATFRRAPAASWRAGPGPKRPSAGGSSDGPATEAADVPGPWARHAPLAVTCEPGDEVRPGARAGAARLGGCGLRDCAIALRPRQRSLAVEPGRRPVGRRRAPPRLSALSAASRACRHRGALRPDDPPRTRGRRIRPLIPTCSKGAPATAPAAGARAPRSSSTGGAGLARPRARARQPTWAASARAESAGRTIAAMRRAWPFAGRCSGGPGWRHEVCGVPPGGGAWLLDIADPLSPRRAAWKGSGWPAGGIATSGRDTPALRPRTHSPPPDRPGNRRTC